MINPMELTGGHVVVTGASSGIGAEVARQAARLGARVSLMARDGGRLERVASGLEGGGHAWYAADLGDPGAVEPAVQLACERGGRFTGAVYCAGVNDTRPLRSVKPEKLMDVASVNYLSFVEFCRCTAAKKRRAGSLSIVGVSSVNAESGTAGKVAYCSTKAAMNGAMRALARELAADGVRANNVLPGWVRTGMYDATVEALGEEAVDGVFKERQYMGGPLDPVDIANAVCFLLSGASRYVTGTEMVVAGGYLS